MTYTVFQKFYADRDRKPYDSDAFDVLISAAAPYVEAIVTERHLAESLRKTKRRDGFLDRLHVLTLSDFRTGRPVAVDQSPLASKPLGRHSLPILLGSTAERRRLLLVF